MKLLDKLNQKERGLGIMLLVVVPALMRPFGSTILRPG
nr:hypothetical protein Q903MT_gene3191 [Picea sitchensis]